MCVHVGQKYTCTCAMYIQLKSCMNVSTQLKVFLGNLLSFSPEGTGSDECVGHIERVQFSLHNTCMYT